MNPKPPPHSIDTEVIVLGAMLLRPSTAIPVVKNVLQPSDFYKETHEHICQSIYDLRDDTDISTVCVDMESKQLLEKCGGKEYVISLVEQVSVSVGLKRHLETLKDLSRRRQLINLCATTAEAAYHTFDQTEETLAAHKSGIRTIEGQQPEEIESNNSIISRRIDVYEARSRGDHTTGVLTGFNAIDSHLRGLQPQCTYYLQAESQTGKSSLALHIADNVADAEPGKKVLYFTLESNRDFLTDRRISRKSQIPLTRLQTGNIREEGEWERIISRTPNELAGNLILLDNSRYQVIENLTAFCESFALKHPISLIIIDHLQLTSSIKKQQSRHLEISHISIDLNFLAKDLNVPMLILSQVNEEGKAKESRDIFNHADVVMDLQRGPEDPKAEIFGKKGRDTGTWKDELWFDRFMMTWKD